MTRPYRERLINEVRQCPVLYDTGNENHRDINARDRCWQEISAKLGMNCEILKREWKILRDSMRQALKRTRNSSSSAGLPGKKWRFQSQMAFLLPYMTKRTQRQFRDSIKMDSSAEPEHSEQEQDTDVWDPGHPPPDHDSLELFFASVCQSTKRLPRTLQNQVKRQVLDALLRAEDELHGEDTKAELSKQDLHLN
ncbi:transcription factor Adf-1-like [Plodia interpunctella]|uniref:transcription factor Adf-1-like n=1 Tax=Plodia interpunctella TaxID=58824 RepID=UPI002368877F|nr:transcription factor Adf-1-like [Plodia interpunctella]